MHGELARDSLVGACFAYCQPRHATAASSSTWLQIGDGPSWTALADCVQNVQNSWGLLTTSWRAVLVLLYQGTVLSDNFFPRLIKSNLKDHPLASRMHVRFVHKHIPHVWLHTTTEHMIVQ